MSIKIFATGGTIDDLEYSSEKDAPVNKQSLIPAVLEELGLSNYSITPLMSKDSRFLTDQDRELIADKCRECDERQIVITHGTITMVETAKYLDALNLGKTIVLTGAMVPANKPGSDAQDNLHLAFKEVQRLSSGVYVSMSGRIFDADNVRKNIEKGLFEELR